VAAEIGECGGQSDLGALERRSGAGGPASSMCGARGVVPSEKAETAARCILRGASSRGYLSRVDPEARGWSSRDVQSARAAVRPSFRAAARTLCRFESFWRRPHKASRPIRPGRPHTDPRRRSDDSGVAAGRTGRIEPERRLGPRRAVETRAGQAIRISAHRRVGLTFSADSRMGRFLNRQQRHNVSSEE
jgi:hypothetical protein